MTWWNIEGDKTDLNDVSSYTNIGVNKTQHAEVPKIDNIKTTWDFEINDPKDSAAYDISYDIFFNNKDAKDDEYWADSRKDYELMIWFATNGKIVPRGKQLGKETYKIGWKEWTFHLDHPK